MTRHFEDRAGQGFPIIQAVALAELDGLDAPNACGHPALVDNDPARPDVKPGADNHCWDHVDSDFNMVQTGHTCDRDN